MDVVSVAITSGVSFGRSVLGLITRPYEAYRRIVDRGESAELVYIGAVITSYFVLASLVKVASFRPFLLTKQFLTLSLGAISGAVVSTLVIMAVGQLFGSATKFRVVFLAWCYTLIPTILWFAATSVLYVILPPPRTTSITGISFSLIFLVFSAALLWWKVTLAYLVLRFGLRFDLSKSIITAVLSAPVLAAWSVLMYRMGIFKVPFL